MFTIGRASRQSTFFPTTDPTNLFQQSGVCPKDMNVT